MYGALAGYLAVLYYRGHDVQYVTWTPLDDALPFWPSWVWVYMAPYVVAPLIAGLLSPATFRWFLKSALITIAISLVIFYFYPTQIAERPAHELEPGLTRWVYERMAQIDDPPANAAPSLHVSLMCLFGLALVRDFPRWWAVTALGGFAVIAATLFTRQHHLIDVATGVLLAFAVAFWVQE